MTKITKVTSKAVHSKSESEVIAMSQSIFPRACLRFMRYTPSLLLALVPLVCHAQSGQFHPRRQMAVSLGASGPTAKGHCKFYRDERFQGGGYWTFPGSTGKVAKSYRYLCEQEFRYLTAPQFQCILGPQGCSIREFLEPEKPKFKPNPKENWL